MPDIDGSALLIASSSLEGDGSVFNGYGAAALRAVSVMSGDGSVENRHLRARLTARASMSGDGAVKRVTLKASLKARASCVGDGIRKVSGAAELVATSSIDFRGGVTLYGAADLLAVATWVGGGRRTRDALGVCDVVREIYMVWGLEYPCKSPGWAREAALTDLNEALQIVWNRARDRNYWTCETITVELLSGESESVLADNIQNVIGPARFADTKQPLMAIGSRQEAAQFAALFLDGDDSGGPQGYHIDRQKQSANDPCRCTLVVAPAPSEDTDFLLDVVREAPRYSWDDITVCPRVPIPHRYVESLLLPVVRYLALKRHLAVVNEAQVAQITKDYETASLLLDEADPLPGKAGDNTNRRKEASA